MRILALSGRANGRFTLVDDIAYEWLAGHAWPYHDGQAGRIGSRMHRAILEHGGVDLRGKRVTHNNLWRLDNRLCNLHATPQGLNRLHPSRRNIQKDSKGFRVQLGQTRYGVCTTREEAERLWGNLVEEHYGIPSPSEQQRLRCALVGLLDHLVQTGDLVAITTKSRLLEDQYRLAGFGN